MRKGIQDEEKVVTPKVRGTEDRSTQSYADPDRKGGNRNIGQQHGNFSSRASRKDWTGGIIAKQFLLTGGIVTRLIRQAEQRLKEHEDCIIWYQSQKEKDLEELDELKELQKLIVETQGNEARDDPE